MAAATRNMLMNEVMLFEPVMQQFYFQKQFNRKCQPIETITPGSLIEFLVKISAKLYLDLTNYLIKIRCQIVNKDKNSIVAGDACKTYSVNFLLHSLFKKVTVQFPN